MTPKSSLVSDYLTNTKAMRNSRDSLITSVNTHIILYQSNALDHTLKFFFNLVKKRSKANGLQGQKRVSKSL